MQTTNASGPTVLVVDDDEFSRAITCKKLALLGVSDVHEASNGRTGMRVLDKMPRPPDFLILDIFMPDVDGIEFVAQLVERKYPGGLILLSGGTPDLLEITTEIATGKGIKLLGAFHKPLQLESLRRALGLPHA